MKNTKSTTFALLFAIVVLGMTVSRMNAQPSEAKIKKDVMGPKTISLTLGGPGTIEWSSTYKKYVWSRNFTAKVKTDTPGEILIVKGYASYDVMGGHYVYWRTFTSSNSYAGMKDPTIAEINQALEKAEIRDFNYNGRVLGEYISMKIAAEPDWEWHTPDSTSFNVVAVFQLIHRGRYGTEAWYTPPAGSEAVDRVEAILRIRLYREGSKLPWSGVHVSSRIPTSSGANTIAERILLLERKEVPADQVRQMPRMTRVPVLTQ